MPAYRHRLLERLGLSLYFQKWKKHGLVIHAASVGEVIALTPLIEKHLTAYPNCPLTVTTFTPTGSAQVIKKFGQRVQHCYLPIDNIVSTTLFLEALKPKAVVFMETELWPNLLAQCNTHNIPLLLINGRLSQKSMRQYHKLSWLIKPSLNLFSKILTQSQDNLENFITLGADKERCQNSGNLKYDISITSEVTTKQAELQKKLQTDKKIWLVASTHEGDEILALNAFKIMQKNIPNLLLMLIPRHPERFNQIAALCQSSAYQFNVSRRSLNNEVNDNTQVWLIDTLGELLAACALADVVTMGGSFSHIGGHNPLEPALFKKPIIVGPNMSNFKEVLAQLKSAQGIEQLPDNPNIANWDITEALSSSVQNYLTSPEKGKTMGENAFTVVQSNQGASDKTLVEIAKLLNP